MIPVKWYMWIMLCAGAATFLYGLATGDPKLILGSFIFSGMGGLAYYSIRSRTYIAPTKKPDAQDTPQPLAADMGAVVNENVGVPMNEAAKEQALGMADAYAKVAKGELSPQERELIEKLRNVESEAYAAFRMPNSTRVFQLADVKPSLERLARDTAELVYGSFSSKTFHECFDEQPMSASWTISDALALWYSLGYFCVLTAAYSLNIEQPAGTAISGATLDVLIARWGMAGIVHSKFKDFYKENMNLVWATYGAVDDAQKLTRFFSVWATRITGGTTSFSPSSISTDALTNSILRGEMRNTDPFLHLAMSTQFTQTRLAIKRVIESPIQ